MNASRGTTEGTARIGTLCGRAKHKVAVLCALVKDRTALVELDELRSVVEELHDAIVGHGGDVIRARFTRP